MTGTTDIFFGALRFKLKESTLSFLKTSTQCQKKKVVNTEHNQNGHKETAPTMRERKIHNGPAHVLDKIEEVWRRNKNTI
jgi:hypothetical protein